MRARGPGRYPKMLRAARERREYLYRKHLEIQQQPDVAKAAAVKEYLKASEKLPSHLAKDALESVKMSEVLQESPKFMPPRILITTSRDPSGRLKQFAKELKLVFPNSKRLNRGNHVIEDIIKTCRSTAFTHVVLVSEHRGNPTGISLISLPHGTALYFSLHNVVLRHDIKDGSMPNVPESPPHIIFHNITTDLGIKVKNCLSAPFACQVKENCARVVSFLNQDDLLSFRQHIFSVHKGQEQIMELGPRFEMQLYEVRNGPPDFADAEIEWSLRPFMRTNKKRNFL